MIDMQKIYGKDELPLQDWNSFPADGGFVGIFRKIGVIGDSLSSGEFQSLTEEGVNTFHDCFDYSWGKYLERIAGTEVTVCSRGGMTAKEFYDSFAEMKGCWDKLVQCDAIIIALGVNDATRIKDGVGSMGRFENVQIDSFAPSDNFVDNYVRIIMKIKRLNPYCHFFFVTPPKRDPGAPGKEDLYDTERDELEKITKFFKRTYLIDLRTYAPVYDQEFRDHFFLGGHMNPAGYLFTAKMIASYMDYIIRHHSDQFHQVAFTHSQIRHPNYFK